ncbi:MAG: metallopeptidase family protein [Planctomycetota bacterium]|nr:metallopeptidase family protein [Planctomycetota bacterium]
MEPIQDEYDPYDESAPGPEDAVVERAWEAIDAGEHEKALAELSSLDPDWPDRWIPEAIALTELGDLLHARAALERVREIADVDDHPDFLWAEGQLLLCEWRVDAAEGVLTKLVALEKSASALERLSLISDLRGDFETADRLFAESVALSGDGTRVPVRLTTDEFDAVLSEAIDELPDEFARPLETTEILVEPVPVDWMIDRTDLSETPPDILGLFVGASELEMPSDSSGHMPRRIFLFQRNLERFAHSREELIEEIRVTLFHEIGHMLGFDEEGVASMGLD